MNKLEIKNFSLKKYRKEKKMKNYLKRTTTFVLALLMLLSVPLQNFAEGKVDHNNIAGDKAKFVNKLTPVQVAKLKEGQTAKEFIKNPDQPAIYTLRTDYKVQRGEKYEIDYQPYIASVGAAATEDEQKKVKKTIDLPALAGYDEPQDNFTIDYDTVKKAADGKGKTGNDANGIRYSDNQELDYKAKSNQIKIKHIFQVLEDFNKYKNPDKTIGDETALFTTQNGNTGSTMEVSPLSEDDPRREGFVPEADHIIMQVPENAENFILEYRYSRAHYDVTFDTAGGTELPARTLYYGQVMPKIADTDIPKKVGGEFQGWKPSVDLKTKDGKKFKANEIIKDGTDAIKNLDAKLLMPASKVTFTAVWKDKEKANYAVQFWAEKADHEDNASLLDKYDYIGTRVYKDQATGMTPDLDNEPVKDIVFPDLDQARLQKIWDNARFNRGNDLYLNKFYVYNQNLTHEQNADPKNTNVIKSVDSTGKTVYNIYYDRQVYDLYFTKSNAQPAENTFCPEIWGYDEAQGEIVKKGGPGDPYHYKARFNQLMLGWPNDAMQTKGFSKDLQSYGWGPNYSIPNWPLYLDTPPYRLNADEFLDMTNYIRWGGYTKKIDKGDGTNIDLKWSDYKTLSFGINQNNNSIPHHMDLWMDGFKKDETIIRYDLYRYKADTNADSYRHRHPKVQGFTAKGDRISAEFLDSDGIDEKNEERAAVTPFPDKTYTDMYGARPVGKMKFIKAFFNNGDEWGDPVGWDGFRTNGYLKFEYSRNKYPLRFNNDPSKIKGDNEFGPTNSIDTFYEFPLKALSPDADTEESYNTENPKNILDNPEKLKELKLTDLTFTDPADGKLKVKRPDNLSDQMVFKGWALDPAGSKLIWENPGEKMPNHPVNLYAKWGEPDYKWKVTFDPNGGSLRNIKEEDLTTSRKKIQEGDIGQEEINTYAKKEANEGDKQVFTVIQRQKLVEPKYKPTRKGYDFMGWEVIHYKKDATTGDYTNEQDTSYRETYKVPELYSFGNDVVAPVYLKAIWLPNDRVDVKVVHHFLSLDLSKETKPPLEQILANKRANYLVATTGDQQNDEWMLAPHEELSEKLTGDLKTLYDEYNGRVKANNTYFQQFRVEPEKKLNTATNQVEDNPDVKNNIFHFFYKPFRTRQYKVNYIDERFKDKENEKEGAIIGQELVENGNRHFDARNYRPIPGWVLADNEKPQQQLFFDVNEETNAFEGINGTGKDEITFYYKDVRVIEVPKNDPVPDGYVRVTFKADKGGSFGKDKDGNPITELNYDVIKGLKSDLLPVPEELAEGKTKEEGKYYITPDNGKKFIKWDKSPLLNKNTIINEAHEFTAYFEWSGLSASGLVRTEAFKDPKGTWTNDFAPTIDQLKKQLVWKEKDQVKDLPAGTEIKLYDEAGNELTSDEQVFALVNEKKVADKDETVRIVNVKAKVTFKEGQDPQELIIPITVYKNVYEALTGTEKPLYLSQAEGKEAKDGGLKDVTGNYVKVTVAPTGDMNSKDNKVYYVNKNAWVVIPEVKPDGSSTFINWTADKDAQNDDGKTNGNFDFAKRHKFTEETVIKPVGAGDVVEQTDPNKKPDVPKTYVKVIVKTTDNATDQTKFEKTFWVNPTKEVTIPVTNPTGDVVKDDKGNVVTDAAGNEVKWIFKEWSKNLKAKFEKETTIEAHYEKVVAEPSIETKIVETYVGREPELSDYEKALKMILGETDLSFDKNVSSFKITKDPDVSKKGMTEAKVKVEFNNGQVKEVTVPVKVYDNIYPADTNGGKTSETPENYVKVTVNPKAYNEDNQQIKYYYVNPKVKVTIPELVISEADKKEYGFKKWTTNNKGINDLDPKEVYDFAKEYQFTADTEIYAFYEKNGEPEVNVEFESKEIVKNIGDKVSIKDYNNALIIPKDANGEPLVDVKAINIIEDADTSKAGYTGAKIQVVYDDGKTQELIVPVKVLPDYVEQKDGEDKPAVPDNFVKVIVDKTEKAKLQQGEQQTQTFWVNPTKEVTIPVSAPSVKEEYKNEGWIFSQWDRPLTGTFTGETTITAKYVVKAAPIVPQPNVKYVITDVGVQPTKDKYLEKITPPADKKIDDIDIIKKPDVSKRGVSSATIKVTYHDGTSVTVSIDVIVQDKNMPPTPGDPDNPDKPNPWNPDYPNPGYPGGSGYPSYPGGPIPRYPEIRYETIVKEKIVKVPVPVTDGYFKEVRYMQGFNGNFRPNEGLTRAEAAQILANALVEDGYKYNPNFKISYKDIGEAWYTRAVKIVTEANVFAGYDDGNFKPQAKITRNEWIATLKRFQELGDASGNNMNLSDNHWAKGEIQAAFNEGWLKIYTDGLATYKGDEFIPRQEVAAVSNKAFKRIVDKTYIGKNNLSLVTYKDVNTSMWAYEDILCASNTFLDRKDRYIAHWVKEDKNQFNIDTSDLKIVQKNFQRNPR